MMKKLIVRIDDEIDISRGHGSPHGWVNGRRPGMGLQSFQMSWRVGEDPVYSYTWIDEKGELHQEWVGSIECKTIGNMLKMPEDGTVLLKVAQDLSPTELANLTSQLQQMVRETPRMIVLSPVIEKVIYVPSFKSVKLEHEGEESADHCPQI